MEITYEKTTYNGHTRTSQAVITSTYAEDLEQLATAEMQLANTVRVLEDPTLQPEQRAVLEGEMVKIRATVAGAKALVAGYEEDAPKDGGAV